MTAALGEALRLLALPLDRTLDEGELNAAYREAAREHHPDGAPEAERERRNEAMRRINDARETIRASMARLAAEPFAAFAPGDDAGPLAGWWGDLAADAGDIGVRWNPAARRVPWARRVEAARRALGVTVGDTVVVEHAGLLRVGRVTAFDSSTRVGLRTTFQGMPVEVRRVGLEVRFDADGSETVDAADVEASGWRCPVCLRTSAHGTPRVRPCPRCLRRFRTGYEGWRDLAAARRRLRRRLNTLDAEPAPFSARRFARFRELDDRLAEAHRRVESTEQTRDHLQRALDEAEAAELRAEERAQRARTPAGAERRRSERDAHATQARRAREALAALDAELAAARGAAAALAAEVDELERELHRRHRAEEQARARSQDRRSAERTRLARELREVEIELGAVAPDAAALLDAFDAWGQAPDRWLGEG